jgi:predicted MFS family arabinose efflux permease
VGSLLSGLFGWRIAFLCLIPVAIAALVWLLVSQPWCPCPARPA